MQKRGRQIRRGSSWTFDPDGMTLARSAIRGDGHLSLLAFGFFRTTFTPYRHLTATSSFDYGCKDPTTERPGRRYLSVERRCRGLESHKGGRKRHTSQGRLWFRQRASHDDKGMSRLVVQRWDTSSQMTRTRWPTNWSTSRSGCTAPISVKRSTGG